MKLKFKINEEYLLIHSINFRKPNPFPKWVEIKNKAWDKSPLAYSFLMGRPELCFLENKENKDLFNKLSKEADSVIKLIKNSKEFKKLKKETEEYLYFVENQWNNNKDKVFKILEEIIGSKLPDETISVFITHPKLHNGMFLKNQNAIGWGHEEDWQNYSTVYLAHEIMHYIMEKKLGNNGRDNISHSIIELATDNELRIRLNKQGKYFEKKGHEHLIKIEKNILSEWKKYLKKDNKKIEDFYKKAKNIKK
jgi:hypothetical protein